MASEPTPIQQTIKFEQFELDLRLHELRRSDRVLKLERIPLELLLLLVEQRDKIVTREDIVERIWGKDVHLDSDNSINGAIRKVRQVLKDDPEQPRFIQTITGKGYRFIAPVVDPAVIDPDTEPAPVVAPPQSTAREDSAVWFAPRRQPVLLGTILGTMVVLIAVVGAYFRWSESQARPLR